MNCVELAFYRLAVPFPISRQNIKIPMKTIAEDPVTYTNNKH